MQSSPPSSPRVRANCASAPIPIAGPARTSGGQHPTTAAYSAHVCILGQHPTTAAATGKVTCQQHGSRDHKGYVTGMST
jgi:hypothetical protein